MSKKKYEIKYKYGRKQPISTYGTKTIEAESETNAINDLKNKFHNQDIVEITSIKEK
jgi:hypothetical protein